MAPFFAAAAVVAAFAPALAVRAELVVAARALPFVAAPAFLTVPAAAFLTTVVPVDIVDEASLELEAVRMCRAAAVAGRASVAVPVREVVRGGPIAVAGRFVVAVVRVAEAVVAARAPRARVVSAVVLFLSGLACLVGDAG